MWRLAKRRNSWQCLEFCTHRLCSSDSRHRTGFMKMHCTLMVREFALRKPFVTSAFTLYSRCVAYLQIFDPDSGLYGYGEAAPLEAFGTGSFDDTLKGLNAQLPSLSECTLHQDLAYELDERFPELLHLPAALKKLSRVRPRRSNSKAPKSSRYSTALRRENFSFIIYLGFY